MEDHVREIEHSSDVLQTHAQLVQDAYLAIANTFTQLEQYGKTRLPVHLASVKDFEVRAAGHREHIQTLKQEMFNLVQYYANFSGAYGALLVEVRRRTEAQIHTAIFINEITTKLQSLFDQEVRARQAFMDLHAAYLPVDLWTGIMDPPVRGEIRTEEGGVLPVLRDGGKRLSSAGMERRRSNQIAMTGSGESAGRRSVDSSGRRSGSGDSSSLRPR